MKRWLFAASLCVVGGWALGAGANPWATSGAQPTPVTSGANWENQPAGADSPGQLDDFIKDLKWEIRRRLEVEMDFGPTSGDSGLMREGSARAFVTGAFANVDNINDADDAADSPGFYVGSTETNTSGVLTTTPPGWAQALGNGRMLFDFDGPAVQPADPTTTTDDDFKMYIWAAGVWNETKAQHDDATELSRAKVGAINLVACGDFDCMGAAETTVPTVGTWAVVSGPPTYSYAVTTNTEGSGLRFRIVSSSSDDGASFTLAGLKNGGTYSVSARVQENAADDVCTIFTTGATTNLANQDSSATGTYETLKGTFVAGAGSVVLNLVGDAIGGTDICDWDHVGVFEESTPATTYSPPSIQYINLAAAVDPPQSPAYTTLLTLDVTVPSSNYGIKASARACVLLTAGGSGVVRLQENAVTKAGGNFGPAINYGNASLEHVNRNPTVGTQYIYTLQGSETSAGASTMCSSSECDCSLTVELVNL